MARPDRKDPLVFLAVMANLDALVNLDRLDLRVQLEKE